MTETNEKFDLDSYERMYRASVENPEVFWGIQADRFLNWQKKWNKVLDWNDELKSAKWFEGGKLNVSWNCLDRHLEKRGDRPAIVWAGNSPGQTRTLTYRELHELVSRLANVLLSHGVKKGSRVCIYMPMAPESVACMLACARIGAVHSVVFGGFSPLALRARILDSDCRIVLTADEARRGTQTVPLKGNVDEALAECPNVKQVIVLENTGGKISWQEGRDLWLHELVEKASPHCPAVAMEAEDPLFILYTSGSTGTPKGLLHTTAGYLLYAAMTHYYTFDYRDGEVFWCTADIGWVTGHSYSVYGPLANGATSLIFEGIPTWPDASRFWQVVEQHRVNIFYTAPTAIRALMRFGDEPVKKCDLSSLRVLGTVGEPFNPEPWRWYHDVIGGGRCDISDTWWQTETGGHMITPLAGVSTMKPGSVGKPFFGIKPAVVDRQGTELSGACAGDLVILNPWPGQARTIYGDHERYRETYFSRYLGKYFSGDGCRRDEAGDYWITGRVDDVINVSGHRIGTAEVENALVAHESVAEAAVVAIPHSVKGQAIYAFVTLMSGIEGSADLKESLNAIVSRQIGRFSVPEKIQWAPGLPKTRSGKIMRRILRKIAVNELEDLGDVSTLADPSVVEELAVVRKQGD